MSSRSDVCVLLPTLNESATVADVIRSYQTAGFSDILVIDGGSADQTRELAREAGATVIMQSGTGKGQAIRQAIEYIEAPYVLMADADMTYRAEDAERMLEPILVGEFDHVIGNRFADMQPGAMTRLNRLGNRLINRAFTAIHGENYRDILSGYRAFRTESVRQLTLSADGFGIETEMAVECAKKNIKTDVVPITYRPRPDGSSTNLRPVKDGGIIFLELYRKAKTNNPLFYFGSVGLVSTVIGLGLSAFVIFRWLSAGVGHEIIAVGAAAAVLFGVQLLLFGVLADLLLSLHREQLSRLDRLAGERHEQQAVSGSLADNTAERETGTLDDVETEDETVTDEVEIAEDGTTATHESTGN